MDNKAKMIRIAKDLLITFNKELTPDQVEDIATQFVTNHSLVKNLCICDVVASLKAWWNKKSIWCRLGMHKYGGRGTGQRINSDYRTGKYVGDVEITEKRHYYKHTCTRKKCGHKWSTDYMWG